MFGVYFVQLGVSIEVADMKGCTPLIVASQYGQTMLVGYLIGKGASLLVTDREGDTALHWAAFKGDHISFCFMSLSAECIVYSSVYTLCEAFMCNYLSFCA